MEHFNLRRKLVIWFFQAFFGSVILFTFIFAKYINYNPTEGMILAGFFSVIGFFVFLIVSLPFLVVWFLVSKKSFKLIGKDVTFRSQIRSYFQLMLAGGFWGGLFLIKGYDNLSFVATTANLHMVYWVGLELSLLLDAKRRHKKQRVLYER